MSNILIVQGSGSAEPGRDSYGSMKRRVAQVAGLEKDPKALDDAGHHLARTIDKLNLHDRYAFLREASTVDTISEGQQTVTFDDDLYIPLNLQLTNLDDEVKYTLEKYRWETMQAKLGKEGHVGRPTACAIFNPYNDRKWYWWPWPDDDTATTLKVKQTFYKRLQRPEGDGDLLQAPVEVAALVELGAQYTFARTFRPNHTALWGSLGRDFRDMLQTMTHRDERDNAFDDAWSYGPGVTAATEGQTWLEAFWNG